MTCINNGDPKWIDKVNPLDPESCEGQCDDDGDGDGGDDGEDGCEDFDLDNKGNCPDWVAGPGVCPVAPLNPQAVHAFLKGVVDIRWDNPAIIAKNTPFDVVGVNIYRSDTSERGPYMRLNAQPVGGTFYRDYTDNALIQDEIVEWTTAWIARGEQANSRNWVFRTQFRPVVKTGPGMVYADGVFDVLVRINGQDVPVHSVFGPTGEITLSNVRGYDYVRDAWIEPVLPTEEAEVTVTYRYSKNFVRTNLDGKVWWRITTVAHDDNSESGYRETPLEFAEPVTFRSVEPLDYIWREAIRRNNWMLEQGGERVKVFIRKTTGERCYCRRDPKTLEFSQQPDSRCLKCYGTGFIGSYEGPYDIIVAPDDADHAVRQEQQGRRVDHLQDVWTGPSPLLTQRDFVVKQTGERYSIGPVRRPTARGNIMQQHFQLRYLDEPDIRYKVPLFDTTELCWPETRGRPAVTQGGGWMEENPPTGMWPVGKEYQQTPMQTEKENIPDEREQRGRTPVYENITY